jgi:hypothetical protein
MSLNGEYEEFRVVALFTNSFSEHVHIKYFKTLHYSVNFRKTQKNSKPHSRTVLLRIRIGFRRDPDPDPAVNLNADPKPDPADQTLPSY